jgi:phosphoglycerol transferase MdoB-like AlkP superfamily enzyme
VTVSALQSGQAWRSWLRIGLLWGVAVGLFLLSGMASQAASRLSLIVAGSILGFFTLFFWVHDLQKKSRRKAVSKGLGAMVALGPHQQYLTDGDGAILASNAEGERISGGAKDMIACLGATLADVEGITGRLLAAAAE